MNFRSLLTRFVVTFLVTLIVAALVTYLWNVLRHGINSVDWDTAFVLAITFGIALPIVEMTTKNRD